MISGQVPAHLIAGARTGFLTAVHNPNELWRRLATEFRMDGKTNDLVDLGAAPMPRRSKGGLTGQDFAERLLTVTPDDWDITVHISYNSVMDDRTQTLWDRVRQAGANFNTHINKIVFDAINLGESANTYGACYDGQPLFSASHIDNGAQYQTAQSNTNSLTLTPDNFETVYVAASTRLDDQGEQTNFMPNLLVVPPAQQRAASQITGNEKISGTNNNDINPWFGKVNHIVAPWLDTTSWFLACESEQAKPLIMALRSEPVLQDTWFDRTKNDGGWYMFKFYARYTVAYADWRLITQGRS